MIKRKRLIGWNGRIEKMENEVLLDRSSELDTETYDTLFQILKRLKEESPQSETHAASMTVKAESVEVCYTISVTSHRVYFPIDGSTPQLVK